MPLNPLDTGWRPLADWGPNLYLIREKEEKHH